MQSIIAAVKKIFAALNMIKIRTTLHMGLHLQQNTLQHRDFEVSFDGIIHH